MSKLCNMMQKAIAWHKDVIGEAPYIYVLCKMHDHCDECDLTALAQEDRIARSASVHCLICRYEAAMERQRNIESTTSEDKPAQSA